MNIKSISQKNTRMLVLVLCCCWIVVFATACQVGQIYETTDIKDYGNFIGTYDDKDLKNTFLHIFPMKFKTILRLSSILTKRSRVTVFLARLIWNFLLMTKKNLICMFPK